MKTFADLKRTLKIGTKIKMLSNDWYPNGPLIGLERVVHKIQSNGVGFLDKRTEKESWLFFDNGAKGFVFDGTNKFSVILNIDAPLEERKLMTYEVLE